MNRIKQTSATTGLDNFVLNASPPSGFVTFVSNHTASSSEKFYYCAVSGAAWEIGVGYLSSSTVLVRERILFSTNSNNKVSFTSGTKEIFETFVGTILTLTNMVHQCQIDETTLDLGQAIHYVQLAEGSAVSSQVSTLNNGLRGDLTILLPDSPNETAELLQDDNIRSNNGRVAAINNGLMLLKDKDNNFQILNQNSEVPLSDAAQSGDLLVPKWDHFDVLWFGNGRDFASGDYIIEYLGGAVNTKRNDLDAWTVGIMDELYHKIVFNDGLNEDILFTQAVQKTALATKLLLRADTHTKTITHTGGKIGICLFQHPTYEGLENINDTILGNPAPTYMLYPEP